MKISQLPYVQGLATKLNELKYIRDNNVPLSDIVRVLDLTPATARELVSPLVLQRINSILAELTSLGVDDA